VDKMTQKAKCVKISYMIPDLWNEKTLRPFRWKEVSFEEFRNEWLKNGSFECVDDIRFGVDDEMILYINYKEGYEKKIDNKAYRNALKQKG